MKKLSPQRRRDAEKKIKFIKQETTLRLCVSAVKYDV